MSRLPNIAMKSVGLLLVVVTVLVAAGYTYFVFFFQSADRFDGISLSTSAGVRHLSGAGAHRFVYTRSEGGSKGLRPHMRAKRGLPIRGILIAVGRPQSET